LKTLERRLLGLEVDLKDDEADIDLLSCEEIEVALKYLKKKKAAGEYSIAVKLLKNGRCIT
jgi:hypothetical protein